MAAGGFVTAVISTVSATGRIWSGQSLADRLVSRLVNSLTYCLPLGPLAKAPVRRCGGSTSRAGNTGPEARATSPPGAPESLDSGVASARFGTTKPSPPRLALKAFRGSVDQRINQTGH